ncbi:kinase-like protein [Tothia fuscella]|uniref:Kinase-like protein n=1 Tax=Tothia fuscella TaxID=1048955 RepID=A0A9P4TUN1_9PEZI|nr:kinase-like protein [Tothia fuscella]
MGSPYNLGGSASQLFFQIKDSAEYKALTLISSLPHPQRTLLSLFVEGAVDREHAAEFFLEEISEQGESAMLGFLDNWTRLVDKIRPVLCRDVDDSLKQTVWERDKGQCCISGARDNAIGTDQLLLTFILPPWLLNESEMAEQGILYRMLKVYIGDSHLLNVQSLINQNSSASLSASSDQLLLLSTPDFDHFENGRFSLKRMRTAKDSPRYLVCQHEVLPSVEIKLESDIVEFEMKATESALPPNQHLLEAHHRFAEALSWLEVSRYMKQPPPSSHVPGSTWSRRICWPMFRIIQYLWLNVPVSIRAFTYERLAIIGHRLYGPTLSDRTHRLPFNLYLRIAPIKWAPKHRAEFQSLQLVEKYTDIPAPRAVDTAQHSEYSYLLMTRVSGQPIGKMLAIMTDEKIAIAVQDLKKYLAGLQHIPNTTGSGFQICNSLGAGILDWRIGDSQREELKFKSEAEFNQYLTSPFDESTQKQAEKAHHRKHGIVFTHNDLNPRNVLADETGKITGIVDWECSGWFPEHWEYTKAHFAVRYTIRWLADVVDRVFPDYREELWVENMLSDLAPPF